MKLKPLRLLAGCLCIVVGLTLIVVLGMGVFGPNDAAPASDTPVLVAMLPSVSFGIAIVAVGVWLITTGRPK